MKDSSQAPLDSHTVFDRIVSELDDAIEKLPLEKMIDSAKFPIGNRSSPIPTLVEVAEDRLDLLAVHARVGDEDAIRALRDLGIRIAKELQYLGDIAIGDIETKDTSISPQRKSIDLGGSSPVVVKLQGDFSEINEVLFRKSDDITTLSLDRGRN